MYYILIDILVKVVLHVLYSLQYHGEDCASSIACNFNVVQNINEMKCNNRKQLYDIININYNIINNILFLGRK